MKRSIYPGSWVVRHQLCCLRWHCLVSNWSYFVVLRPFTMLYVFTHRRYYANPFLYIIQTFLPNYFIFPLNKQMPQLLQTAFFFPPAEFVHFIYTASAKWLARMSYHCETIASPGRPWSLSGTNAGRSYRYFYPVVGETTETCQHKVWTEGLAGLVNVAQTKRVERVVIGYAGE